MCKAHFISCFANSCNLIKFLKQYLNIFVRNFVLCIQIRFVSTEKNYAHRLACILFLVVFSFFEKTTYCCRTRRLSVRLSVRPSVEIISFRGNSLPNRPIELKIGLNVREGVVHVRKAWFFEILIASCKFMQFAIFCK